MNGSDLKNFNLLYHKVSKKKKIIEIKTNTKNKKKNY